MRVKKSFASALIIGAILTAGCAENPADNVSSASVNTPAAATGSTPGTMQSPSARATPEEVTVYLIGDGTEVGWVGSKVTGSHNGGFKKVSGTITVPGQNLDQAQVNILVDATSIYADDEKLTTHLKSEDFFAVDSYPTATFKSTKIAKTETGYEVTGDLTLHGETKSITFPATIELHGDDLKTQAEFSINRKDFGIVYAGKPDDLIRDQVVIKFDISAKKAG